MDNKKQIIVVNKKDNTVYQVVPQIDRIYRTIAENITIKPSVRTIRNAISFKNTGTVNATVKGQPVLAGDPMLSFTAEIPTEDITSYEVIFDPGAGTRKIDVIEIHIVDFRIIPLSAKLVEKPEDIGY